MGTLTWAKLSNSDQKILDDPSYSKHFSSGDSILVNKYPWLNKTDNSEKWKDTCQQHWNLKTEKKFKKFIEQCPNDSEARIYLNNSEAADMAAKSSGNVLVKVGVSVPISRDNGQGVYDSLEILRGASFAQQEINKEGGIQIGDIRLFIQINIVDDGNRDSSIYDIIQAERIEARKAAKFLATKEDITGIIGHFSSDATEAASEIYRNYGLILISPTSTAVRATGNLWGFLPFKFK
ncbi:ABC transporter substrate-binding protein [Nostoc sp. FACHB-280]|uniref:ABC transporter substrate-binding protein n=1 Tax=Nostoc sp. FACHB-280 TaxID=2692839 RepID=UPI0019C07B63|nr:ABC transporter substrate-binding protein [Nostoc sp. FACHB-280]MBD2497032.1 amino acid ABC transporter substrate-binding protein [Nostoc sp. FACHB-280]